MVSERIKRKRRNIAKAAQAKKHGAKRTRTIADEAAKAGIPYAVAFATVEHESGFQNIFGHDRGGMYQGQKVTRAKVNEMQREVHAGNRVSNGVGFTQLTYIGFIDQAQRLVGGASRVRNQCRVGFNYLHSLFVQYGNWREALRAYNGSGPAAEEYADEQMKNVERWERQLKLPSSKHKK